MSVRLRLLIWYRWVLDWDYWCDTDNDDDDNDNGDDNGDDSRSLRWGIL